MHVKLVYYSSSCTNTPKSRGDGFRVFVTANKLSKTNQLKTIAIQESIYDTSYVHIRQDKSVEYLDELKNGEYRFIIRAEYLQTFRYGCNPLLRIQFMASDKGKYGNCGSFAPGK